MTTAVVLPVFLLLRWRRGTARSGVEGAAVARCLCVRLDHPKRCVQILEHEARRDTQSPYAAQGQPGVAFCVASLRVAEPMRLAIDFNAKLGSIAIEIQHIGADGVLAPEP